MRKVVCSLVFLGIIGCLNSEQESNAIFQKSCYCEPNCNIVALEAVKEINVPVDRLQYEFDIATVYSNASNTQFWGYNAEDRKIYSYDLVNQTFIDSIKIVEEGPNAIPEFFGMKVISPDSIYLHANHFNELILINNDGVPINSWPLVGDIPNGGFKADGYHLATSSKFNNLFIDQKKEKSIFFAYESGIYLPENDFKAFSHPQFVELDLNTGKYIEAYGDYPIAYKNQTLTNYNVLFPFTVAEGEVWASFFNSHCIYIFDGNRRKVSLCSRSNYMPEQFEFLPRGLTPAERDPKLIPSKSYRNIIYDPFRRIIYRIVHHGLPESVLVSRDWGIRQKGKWSIMFLDLNGQCLGEAIFKGGKYNYEQVFAVKEGLLISLENKFNTKNKEEILSFELFDVASFQ